MNNIPFTFLRPFTQIPVGHLTTVIFEDRRACQAAQYHAFILVDTDDLNLDNPEVVFDHALVRATGKSINETCEEVAALLGGN